jgi:hypothetical protein
MSKRKSGLILVSVFLFLIFSMVLFANATSWSSDKPLTSDLNFDVVSSITQTRDRNIWVVWQKEVSSTHTIFYKVSSDYGHSWSFEKNITNFPSFDVNTNPSIVQLSNGTIWVVYSALKHPPPEPDFDLAATPSSLNIPKGGSGTSTITVTSIGGFNSQVTLSYKIVPRASSITVSFSPNPVTPPPNGKVNSTMLITVGALTTPETYTITVIGTSTDPSKTDSTTVTVTVPATSGSSNSAPVMSEITVLSTSSTQAQGNYEIYYKASHNNGTSWSQDVNLTNNPTDDFAPSIMQASNGTIWLAWSSIRTGNYEIFYKTSSNLGTSWSSDTQLTLDSYRDSRPAIAQMKDGRIWVVWYSDRYGNNEILYKIYNGSAWSADTRLTTNSMDNSSPAILQTADGAIWIFWSAYDAVQYRTADIYYKQSLDNGATWLSPNQLTTDTGEDVWPAVMQSVDSRVWVVWASNRTGSWDIFYRTSLVHNIAVTNVSPSPMRVYQKEIVSIAVTIQNFGDFNESFTVFCYVNSTLIGSQLVSLGSGQSKNLVFYWNTSGFSRGNYIIKAEASVVAGELYTEDNTITHKAVRVKLLGDVNDNGIVNVFDLFALGKAFGSAPGSSNWNEETDMNGDNAINIIDLSALCQNFGKTG